MASHALESRLWVVEPPFRIKPALAFLTQSSPASARRDQRDRQDRYQRVKGAVRGSQSSTDSTQPPAPWGLAMLEAHLSQNPLSGPHSSCSRHPACYFPDGLLALPALPSVWSPLTFMGLSVDIAHLHFTAGVQLSA